MLFCHGVLSVFTPLPYPPSTQPVRLKQIKPKFSSSYLFSKIVHDWALVGWLRLGLGLVGGATEGDEELVRGLWVRGAGTNLSHLRFCYEAGAGERK
jgi:hypothetical protein